MNLHITPSFNKDRLCKTASVLPFLVHFIQFFYYLICQFSGKQKEFYVYGSGRKYTSLNVFCSLSGGENLSLYHCLVAKHMVLVCG